MVSVTVMAANPYDVIKSTLKNTLVDLKSISIDTGEICITYEQFLIFMCNLVITFQAKIIRFRVFFLLPNVKMDQI